MPIYTLWGKMVNKLCKIKSCNFHSPLSPSSSSLSMPFDCNSALKPFHQNLPGLILTHLKFQFDGTHLDASMHDPTQNHCLTPHLEGYNMYDGLQQRESGDLRQRLNAINPRHLTSFRVLTSLLAFTLLCSQGCDPLIASLECSTRNPLSIIVFFPSRHSVHIFRARRSNFNSTRDACDFFFSSQNSGKY